MYINKAVLPAFQPATLSLAIGRVLGGLASQVRSLFSAGEQGVWYDPSDMSTLFQDTTATVPVTAMEQPVGLMLDKRLGLVRGSELWDTGAVTTSNSTIVPQTGGFFDVTATANFAGIRIVAPGLVSGKTYRIEAEWSGNNEGRSFSFNVGGGTASFANATAASGTGTAIVTATGASSAASVFMAGSLGGETFTVRVVSLKELPGNHATQATSASRPVVSARVNMLTRTEELNQSPWSFGNASGGATLVGKTVTMGASAVDRITVTTSSNIGVGIPITASVTLSGSGEIRFFVLSGTGGTKAVKTINLTSTPTRYTTTYTNEDAGANNGLGIYNSSTGVAGTVVTITEPQVEFSTTTTTRYQRVNTPTDYDSAGFPVYLKFDGVDDWMVTGAPVGATGTGYQISYAAFTTTPAANQIALTTGRWWSSSVSGRSRFTTASVKDYEMTSTNFSAGNKVVVSQYFDAAFSATLRANGTQEIVAHTSDSTTTEGALVLGRAQPGGNYWTGGFFGVVIRKAAPSFTNIERYLATKSGVILP